jgi:hypothetical protein
MALPQAGYKGDNPQIWKGTTNSWIRAGDVPPACMLDMGLTSAHHRKTTCYELLHRTLGSDGYFGMT